MDETIVDRLSEMGVLAEYGANPPPLLYDLLKKAYRLKNFNRCPRCDEHIEIVSDSTLRVWELRCSCGWRVDVSMLAAAKSDPDELFVEIVKRETQTAGATS